MVDVVMVVDVLVVDVLVVVVLVVGELVVDTTFDGNVGGGGEQLPSASWVYPFAHSTTQSPPSTKQDPDSSPSSAITATFTSTGVVSANTTPSSGSLSSV